MFGTNPYASIGNLVNQVASIHSHGKIHIDPCLHMSPTVIPTVDALVLDNFQVDSCCFVHMNQLHIQPAKLRIAHPLWGWDLANSQPSKYMARNSLNQPSKNPDWLVGC